MAGGGDSQPESHINQGVNIVGVQGLKNIYIQSFPGWRNGSVVKSTSRGPEFKSQQPHGGSQPSVINK